MDTPIGAQPQTALSVVHGPYQCVVRQPIPCRDRFPLMVLKTEQSPAVRHKPESPGRIRPKTGDEAGKIPARLGQESLAVPQLVKPFGGGRPTVATAVASDVLDAEDAGDPVLFTVAQAVKAAAALFGRSTEPECAVAVLIDASHGRGLHVEMGHHARSPPIQPSVSAEPKVAIGCLRNGENVAQARNLLKPAPIEPIEPIPSHPDAAFPILKHRIEARIGEAFALSESR